MADIKYFLEPKSWKVTAGSGPCIEYLPDKGSIRIEAQPNGSSPTYRIVPAGRLKVKPKACEGFKYLKGRLERPTHDSCVLVIEQGDTRDGIARLTGRVEPRPGRKGIKRKPELEMTGTWGAETPPPPGGGGGGKGY
jgi:hypothetical protein